MSEHEYTKPLPDVDDPVSAPFWAAARRHELSFQRCDACSAFRWHPDLLCPECQTIGGEWTVVPPAGMLYSYATYHRALEAVVLGPGGVLEYAHPGLLLVEMSTIAPEVSRFVAERGAKVGVQVLDAPVSGGEAGAVEGSLSVMVGGAADNVARARPVFEVLGSTVVHVGPSGAGQTVKAANQLVVAGTIELVAEALVFLEAHGVDTEAAVEVLRGGLAGNRIFDRKAAGMLARQFQPGFRIELHHKDLGIALSAAREAGVVLPLGALVGQLMASLRAQGHGSLDHSALLLLVEQLSGRAGTDGLAGR